MGGSNGEEYCPMGGDSGWMAARGVAASSVFFFHGSCSENNFLETFKITEREQRRKTRKFSSEFKH